VFTLPETLTLAHAKAAVRSIEDALGQGNVEKGALVIDAAGLRTFDTSAIAVLLEARRLAQAAGRGLEVCSAPPAMVELSGLYGVDALLGFAPNSDLRPAPGRSQAA
jgi:phospholipid transport system transporter-binding protein